jgi:hypothetical protein
VDGEGVVDTTRGEAFLVVVEVVAIEVISTK